MQEIGGSWTLCLHLFTTRVALNVLYRWRWLFENVVNDSDVTKLGDHISDSCMLRRKTNEIETSAKRKRLVSAPTKRREHRKFYRNNSSSPTTKHPIEVIAPLERRRR